MAENRLQAVGRTDRQTDTEGWADLAGVNASGLERRPLAPGRRDTVQTDVKTRELSARSPRGKQKTGCGHKTDRQPA